MSNFAKLMQQAASGSSAGGSSVFRADTDDSGTELWIGGHSWFPNGSGYEASANSAASASTIYFSALDTDYDLHIYKYSSDGTISSNKIELVDMKNSSGAVVDPYDTDYIYAGGAYQSATPQAQLCKLDSSLSNTTAVWNYQTNLTGGTYSGTAFNPVFTPNYIYFGITASNKDFYVVKIDRDGNVDDVLKFAQETTNDGVTTVFTVSADETVIYFGAEDSSGNWYVSSFDLSDNSLNWTKYTSISIIRAIDCDNSDNGVIASLYVGNPAYGYLTKFDTSGSVDWSRRFGDGSAAKIRAINLSIKNDGSSGAWATYEEDTNAQKTWVGTFDPSDGSLGTNSLEISGNSCRVYTSSIRPCFIGNRIYMSGYVYNDNGPPTFEGWVGKFDSAFDVDDDATNQGSGFLNSVNLNTKTTITNSTNSLTWTSGTGPSLTSVSTTNFLDTAGPSNIQSSTLTPDSVNTWRS